MRLWLALLAFSQVAVLLVSLGYAVGSFRLLRLSTRSAAACSFGIILSAIGIAILLFARITTSDEAITWKATIAVPVTLLGTGCSFVLARSIWRALNQLHSCRSKELDEIEDMTRRIFR